jgi:hypothetical protein
MPSKVFDPHQRVCFVVAWMRQIGSKRNDVLNRHPSTAQDSLDVLPDKFSLVVKRFRHRGSICLVAVESADEQQAGWADDFDGMTVSTIERKDVAGVMFGDWHYFAGVEEKLFVRPNVRAKRATTAGRQARAGENAPCATGRAWWPAVGAPLERGVRPRSHPTVQSSLAHLVLEPRFREVETVGGGERVERFVARRR